MIADLHATYEIDRYRSGRHEVPESAVKDFLTRLIGKKICEGLKELPVVFTETESAWSPNITHKVDMYIVSEKLFNILKYKITPDMLLRLENVDTTELMKFIAKHDNKRI